MRKSISLLVCLSLLSCLSLKLYAQSAEKELDQEKLIKQLIGTWEAKVGGDTTILLTVTPSFGKGLNQKLEWKADGKVYFNGISVIGFSDDFNTIFMTIVWAGGDMTIDIGRFVSDKKLVMERFRQSSPMHAVALEEYDFSSPNFFAFSHYQRGQNLTWEPLWEYKPKFTKIDSNQ
jgi:hypothetical protein